MLPDTFGTMKISMRAVVTLFLCITSFWAAYGQKGEILAGVTQINITPETGYPHYRTYGTGVDDSLFVKAIVFRQGNIKWGIAVCDLLWIERGLSAEVRTRVAEKTGIPFGNLMLTATHTHTGPAYEPDIYELNEHVRKSGVSAEQAVAKNGYPALLVEKITEALVSAHKRAVPARLRSAKDSVGGLSFNRRFILKDGKVKTNPGRGNRDIVQAAGPVDPALDMVFIEKQSDGSLMGVVSNFAVHADTYGGTAFSADYPGVLDKNLREKIKGNFVSLFLQGASGDINHIDVRKNGVVLKTDSIGKRLAAHIAAKAPRAALAGNPSLGAVNEFVYLPLQSYNDDEKAWANDSQALPKYGETGLFQMRRPMKIRSLERMRATEAVPPTIESEPWALPLQVQVFKLTNDLVIVGVPGEVFAELGLAIRKASPFKMTMVVELTNVHIAYLPTRKAFLQGGYETLNSRLAPGGGELLVESAIRQLKQLKSQ